MADRTVPLGAKLLEGVPESVLQTFRWTTEETGWAELFSSLRAELAELEARAAGVLARVPRAERETAVRLWAALREARVKCGA